MPAELLLFTEKFSCHGDDQGVEGVGGEWDGVGWD